MDNIQLSPSAPTSQEHEKELAPREYATPAIAMAATLRLLGWPLIAIRRNAEQSDPRRNEKFFVLKTPEGLLASSLGQLLNDIRNDVVTVGPFAFHAMVRNLRDQIREQGG